ncbi:MAG: hypothetical protein DWQ34_07195 [Planctomycetota bacterium]|nr:MAG: hypothetical protein DWQ34_07195 [Planctomycetota bacterium]REK23443.1 MAG: hypothetical protein DWQ41_16975 [Planctomycetota bacterium]REK38917.1 MAG: hypothetical protein DWQ45_03480 [Planctomycetota bacterium]
MARDCDSNPRRRKSSQCELIRKSSDPFRMLFVILNVAIIPERLVWIVPPVRTLSPIIHRERLQFP